MAENITPPLSKLHITPPPSSFPALPNQEGVAVVDDALANPVLAGVDIANSGAAAVAIANPVVVAVDPAADDPDVEALLAPSTTQLLQYEQQLDVIKARLDNVPQLFAQYNEVQKAFVEVILMRPPRSADDPLQNFFTLLAATGQANKASAKNLKMALSN